MYRIKRSTLVFAMISTLEVAAGSFESLALLEVEPCLIGERRVRRIYVIVAAESDETTCGGEKVRKSFAGSSTSYAIPIATRQAPATVGAAFIASFWRPESPMDSKASCLRACATNLIPGPMGAIS